MSVRKEPIFVIIAAITQLEVTIVAVVLATDFTMIVPHVTVSWMPILSWQYASQLTFTCHCTLAQILMNVLKVWMAVFRLVQIPRGAMHARVTLATG